MYSDRVEAETGSRKTVKNRLNGGPGNFSTRRRQVTRKRERQDDDKWEHDLFNDDKSNGRVDPRDLRLKLQKKHHGFQSGRGASLGVRDLREKLSGTTNPQPAVKKFAAETKTASNKATKTKPQQADASVDSFLESLGIEKYSTAFQVEEVDMDALLHMTDDDLRSMLIPLGPRKKILLALGSKRG